jgi:CRISPR-associated protein Cas1
MWFLKKLMYARPNSEEYFNSYLAVIGNAASSLRLPHNDLENARSSLMGIEGTAGRAYFQCLSGLLPGKHQFDGRSRRPARDPFNATLNYCYGILYSQVEKSCILAGLDPYIGFLHTDNYNKKSLVFDLIEPFRIYGEQVSIYLFTGKQMKDESFDEESGAVSLNAMGKPVVVEAMNNHLDESVRYRRKNVKRRHIIQHEAHRLANILLTNAGMKRPDWLEIKEI